MEQIEGGAGEGEFLEALRSTRRAKNVLMILIMLAVGTQMAAMVIARFTGALEGTPVYVAAGGTIAAQASSPSGTTTPAGAPATAAPTATAPAEAVSNAWEVLLTWLLPATKFLALAAGLLLVLTLMFAVKIALHGRTGGTAGFLSAFYWSLILFLPLVPWQQVMPGSGMLAGALYNLGDLARATARVTWGAEAGFLAHVFYYLRFIGYPIVTLGLMGIVCTKFSRGWRRATLGVQTAVAGPSGIGAEKIRM